MAGAFGPAILFLIVVIDARYGVPSFLIGSPWRRE
jgi:hypothetical protein